MKNIRLILAKKILNRLCSNSAFKGCKIFVTKCYNRYEANNILLYETEGKAILK